MKPVAAIVEPGDVTAPKLRIPQASENPYEPAPVTLAERRAARGRWFGHGPSERGYLGRHVYFVDTKFYPGVIKIGSAFDVEMRVRELQTGSPVLLRILGYVHRGGLALERKLHRRFRQNRSHHEWFYLTCPQVARAVAELGHELIEVWQ